MNFKHWSAINLAETGACLYLRFIDMKYSLVRQAPFRMLLEYLYVTSCGVQFYSAVKQKLQIEFIGCINDLKNVVFVNYLSEKNLFNVT